MCPRYPQQGQSQPGTDQSAAKGSSVACWTRGLSNVVVPVPPKSKLQYGVMWMKWCGNSLTEQRYLPLYTLTLLFVSPGPCPIPPPAFKVGEVRQQVVEFCMYHTNQRSTYDSARVKIIMQSQQYPRYVYMWGVWYLPPLFLLLLLFSLTVTEMSSSFVRRWRGREWAWRFSSPTRSHKPRKSEIISSSFFTPCIVSVCICYVPPSHVFV